MKYGHFDDKTREYVIDRPDIPVSWTNYLGVKDTCGVISHNAGGYNFYKSSSRGRYTRFRHNALPIDRPGRYVYLRDEADGDYWSVSWQPVGKDLSRAKHEVRHGLSYSKFSCEYKKIFAEQTVFIPRDEENEVWLVRIRNDDSRERSIAAFSYLEFAFVDIREEVDLQFSLYMAFNSYRDGVIAYKPIGQGDFYFAATFEPDSFDTDREKFIGDYRTETNPAAVEKGGCSNTVRNGGNTCGCLHKKFVLPPGGEVAFVFVTGVGDEKQARKLRKKYSAPEAVGRELKILADHWEEKLSVLRCKTPDDGFNSMINIWNAYQVATCVTWSRFASFIEVGGRTGLGYRDTSQDVMAVIHNNREKARQRICELLQAQTADGYAIHLFDPLLLRPGKEEAPPLSNVCSDDVLWLIATVCEFVKETGDLSFFDLVLPFADKGKATVYGHLRKGLDFSVAHTGKHGICLGLKADWNDCLNLRNGGESAMVSFQLYWALEYFIEAAALLGKKKDAEKYRQFAQRVQKAVNEVLWDGKWFIRAITGKGIRIGSSRNEEGKIYLNSQSWAVYSGLADRKKALQCMDSVYKHLFSEYGIHLVAPAYTKTDEDVGFITRVAPGLKENGAIFSHPNPWAIIAECLLGRGDRAYELYNAIAPHRQNDKIEVREAEPYSYCQFVVGRDHPGFGRARHPWLTGTCGWFYTAATRYMLGFKPGYDGFTVDPCVPKSWTSFSFERKFRGATYKIEVSNPGGVEKGVKEAKLNGKIVRFPVKPQKKDSVNQVSIVMGPPSR